MITEKDLIALKSRSDAIDPILEVDFDTQGEVERDPYGATKAIEDALYLIRDQGDAIVRLWAEVTRLSKIEKTAKELQMALRVQRGGEL